MSVIKAFTGDLLNRQTKEGSNKRRHSFFGSSEDEVLFGFSSVFDKLELNESETLVLRSATPSGTSYPSRKCNNYPRCHEHTIKLFVSRITDDVVSRGLKDCLSELGVDYVDCLILSVSETITVKELDAVWKQMEGEKKSGRANTIGIADLDEDKLRHICEWSSISPDVHQICPIKYNCSASFQTIVNLGHKYNVRTTSHGDPKANPYKMTLDLKSLLGETDKNWATDFTARYIQRSKDRNIITQKGYTMQISQVE